MRGYKSYSYSFEVITLRTTTEAALKKFNEKKKKFTERNTLTESARDYYAFRSIEMYSMYRELLGQQKEYNIYIYIKFSPRATCGLNFMRIHIRERVYAYTICIYMCAKVQLKFASARVLSGIKSHRTCGQFFFPIKNFKSYYIYNILINERKKKKCALGGV